MKKIGKEIGYRKLLGMIRKAKEGGKVKSVYVYFVGGPYMNRPLVWLDKLGNRELKRKCDKKEIFEAI